MKFDAEDLGFIISKKMKMGKKDAQKMLIKMMTIMTLLIGFGLAFSINDIKVHLTGIETIGTVTHISVKVDEEDGSKTYQPTFNYHCWETKDITSQTRSYSNHYNYSLGKQVKLLCDPANPKNFSVAGFKTFLPLIVMSIFGLIMFVLAFFLWKKYKKIKNLIENGLSIQAKITAIEESSYNENSKVSYDYLVATYKDHVFESAEFPSRISALLKPGDEVRVYIDPLDHKNYWVDIDQLQEDLNQKISTPQISTVDSQIPPQSS